MNIKVRLSRSLRLFPKNDICCGWTMSKIAIDSPRPQNNERYYSLLEKIGIEKQICTGTKKAMTWLKSVDKELLNSRDIVFRVISDKSREEYDPYWGKVVNSLAGEQLLRQISTKWKDVFTKLSDKNTVEDEIISFISFYPGLND